MPSKKIILYSLSTCSYCDVTRKMLDDLEVPYTAVVVDLLSGNDREETVRELTRFNPRCTFPTVVFGEKVIIGMKLQEIKEALGVRTEIDDLYEMLRKTQEAKGYFFNSDREKTFHLLRALLFNKDRYGYMSCPCRLASGNRGDDKDIICPCIYREEDVMEYGSCYCGLYVSEEWNKGSIPRNPVPERRQADYR